MKEKLYLLCTITIIIILVLLVVIYIYYDVSRDTSNLNSNTKENFIANSNLITQTPMNFNYLTNPNYARDILATYYLDNDKKINGQRAVYHPYMYSYDNNYGRYWWYPPISNHIYKYYGIRM